MSGSTRSPRPLRRAAIRYLHRAAGHAVPTGDACGAETVAAIRRDAARHRELPAEKAAATATILRQILAPIANDLRDRALLLTGSAGALRRSELAATRVEQLEKTERGLRLTLPQTKGSQTDAVAVPLPYGQTELCPACARRLAECRGTQLGRGVPPELAAPARRVHPPLPAPRFAARVLSHPSRRPALRFRAQSQFRSRP